MGKNHHGGWAYSWTCTNCAAVVGLYFLMCLKGPQLPQKWPFELPLPKLMEWVEHWLGALDHWGRAPFADALWPRLREILREKSKENEVAGGEITRSVNWMAYLPLNGQVACSSQEQWRDFAGTSGQQITWNKRGDWLWCFLHTNRGHFSQKRNESAPQLKKKWED